MPRRRPAISGVRFSPATQRDVARGLLGFIECTLDCGLRLKGLTLRRTRAGDLRLSFPEYHDRRGRPQALVFPATTSAREALEAGVIRALEAQGILRGTSP